MDNNSIKCNSLQITYYAIIAESKDQPENGTSEANENANFDEEGQCGIDLYLLTFAVANNNINVSSKF